MKQENYYRSSVGDVVESLATNVESGLTATVWSGDHGKGLVYGKGDILQNLFSSLLGFHRERDAVQ